MSYIEQIADFLKITISWEKGDGTSIKFGQEEADLPEELQHYYSMFELDDFYYLYE